MTGARKVAALLLALAAPAAGEAPVLLRDIRTIPDPSAGALGYVWRERGAALEGVVYYQACDERRGCELWRTDGTAAGTTLVKDIFPGPASSYPSRLARLGRIILFAADDGHTGRELWRTDGTPAGTVKVKDIAPAAPSSWPGDGVWTGDVTGFVVSGGAVFFAADDDAGRELWRSDGTAEGTVRVKDIASGGDSSRPHALVDVEGTLFFAADDGQDGDELWRSDGTEAGTVRVADVFPGARGSDPRFLTSFRAAVYFAAAHPVTGDELWRSDGTEAGTAIVKDILPQTIGSRPRELTASGGALYFVASELYGWDALWRSDGTEGGTSRVLPQLQGPSSLCVLQDSAGTLFFVGAGAAFELWASDGTPSGTRSLASIGQVPEDGGCWSYAFDLASAGGWLLFNGADSEAGWEPWRSDGTPGGTVRIADIHPGRGSSCSWSCVVATSNGVAFFSADDGSRGPELWTTDGTEPGTTIVADTAVLSSIDPLSAHTWNRLFAGVGGRPVFPADDGRHGSELWTSDGLGTRLVKDMRAGRKSPFDFLPNLFATGDTLFFRAEMPATGLELWKTDGTTDGTVLVKDIHPGKYGSYPQFGASVGRALFFGASTLYGADLWRTDGTREGTRAVKADTGAWDVTAVGDRIFFVGYADGSNRDSLWASDGTAAGTFPVARPETGLFQPYGLTAAGGRLFFLNTWRDWQQEVTHVELWTSDGTEAGTVRVKDFPSGSVAWYLRTAERANMRGTLFFVADDGERGSELWRSDGTEAGTILVKDIRPGPVGAFPRELTNLGGTLYFTADDGESGFELWKTDGTEAGTILVEDVRPGPEGSNPAWLAAARGGTLFFAADDGMHGTELWKSDGSSGRTVLVADIAAGIGSSAPQQMAAVGGRLLFVADDGVTGREPWSLTLRTPRVR